MAPVKEDSMVLKELIVGGTISGTRTGRPALFQAILNSNMGDFFNASKSYVDMDVTGGVAGLLSAHNMELRLPSTVQPAGHLTCAEHEIVCQASTTVNSNISFAWFQVSGDSTALADFLDKGSFFELTGMGAASAGNIFDTIGSVTPTHELRIKIDDVNYFIMLQATQ